MKKYVGQKNTRRIMDLLELYEGRDFFTERANYLENSRLSIHDELLV